MSRCNLIKIHDSYFANILSQCFDHLHKISEEICGENHGNEKILSLFHKRMARPHGSWLWNLSRSLLRLVMTRKQDNSTVNAALPQKTANFHEKATILSLNIEFS